MGRTLRKRRRKTVLTCDNEDFIALQKWMRLKTDLEIRCFPGTGRGIMSKKRIRIGDEIISLPLSCLITPNVFRKLFNNLETSSFSPQSLLSLFLVYEKHLAERNEEIEILPPFMRDDVIEKKCEIEKEYKKIAMIFRNETCTCCATELIELFQYSQFTWAWFTVNSRSVYYKSSESDTVALAPFLDMFNHSLDAKTEMLIDSCKKHYILKSLCEYKRKEEVFIKYGSHSNFKLLSEYGFILENNPHDAIEFSYYEIVESVKEHNPQYGTVNNIKYKLIKRHNLDKNLTKSKEEFSWNVNALLYVLVTRDEHPSAICAKLYSNEFSENECMEIEKIREILMGIKLKELNLSLVKMESIANATESFSLAKKLVKEYLSLLE